MKNLIKFINKAIKIDVFEKKQLFLYISLALIVNPLFSQDFTEECVNAIANNHSSMVVKKILAKEIPNSNSSIPFNNSSLRNSNIALSGVTEKYISMREKDAIADFTLRTTFDVLSGSLSLATIGTGPLAPIINKGVSYVADKSLEHVADMAEDEMKRSSGKFLKHGIKNYLRDNGIESIKDKNPKVVVETLQANGYFPGIEIDDSLDENGQKIVMGAMINELSKTDEITLNILAEQGENIENIEQDVINLKALGQQGKLTLFSAILFT
ncbi:hypothetical protein [Changchengzhania lutea]|uniref:hypothetical protein n=1 Tax=Changchengzhania lutea TaxID=2049305 RepID=UPI00115D6DCE|nr:hypothetical protein [Changchengzhania lutea]